MASPRLREHPGAAYACLALAAALCFALPAAAAEPQAPLAGVANFHKVDENVYRGAQPSQRGLEALAQMGIKTVIDLRGMGEHSAAEAQTAGQIGLHYIHIPLSGFEAPPRASVDKALGILEDSSQGPVFIHCRRGSDRTGTVIACYRIEHDRWTSQKALDEAGRLGMYWYELPMRRFVRSFQPSLALKPALVEPALPAGIASGGR